MKTDRLLSDISAQMGYAVAFDKPLDKKDWSMEWGVLLTVQEADVFRHFLLGTKKESVFTIIRKYFKKQKHGR